MMKAIIFEKYGAPENLILREVEKPNPKNNEVLIKVHATSLNPYDWHHLRGMLPVQLSTGLFKPTKTLILGADVAGVVQAVGKEVTQFKPGDEVFGDVMYGGLAAYVCAPEKGLALKPENMTFLEAASIPMVGITALQGLTHYGQPTKGQKILIHGASGGIGTMAVQLAKYYGAEVTAVSSTSKVELVRSLGADRVIDYQQETITGQYDLVMDNVGNLSKAKIRSLLRPGGKAAITGYSNYKLLLQMLLFGGKRMGMVAAQSSHEDLSFLAQLLDQGKIKPVIEKIYPLEETAEAMKKVASRHVRGKVVIGVSANG